MTWSCSADIEDWYAAVKCKQMVQSFSSAICQSVLEVLQNVQAEPSNISYARGLCEDDIEGIHHKNKDCRSFKDDLLKRSYTKNLILVDHNMSDAGDLKTA